MTADELKNLFEKEYDRKEWTKALVDIFHIRSLYEMPQKIELGANDYGAAAFELGYFETTEGLQVGIYEVCISTAKKLDRNKAGLRQLMRKVFKVDNDAALIVFTQGSTWRFTYASELTLINKETGLRERRQTDSKRYTYLLGRGQQCRTATERFSGLKSSSDLFSENKISITEIEKAFSVETLTKQFYKELFDWYQWALSDNDGFAVTYPNDTSISSDDRKIEEHLIRLITRLMFVWFIKQKNLVPDEIFNKDALASLLKEFDPLSKSEGNYYNAILQNFFFATLNKSIKDRAFANDGEYHDRKEHYGIKSLLRNPKGDSWFNVTNDEILQLFSKAPFLNGGLFECLDKEEDSNGRIVYHDGFSREAGRQRRAFIPNCLFFDPVKGIIPLLEKYNFTIEESTPIDVEVALDPELLGKVFENLLGAFNPETKETARKQSGSFYTPREIVSYMVDESLIAYLNTKCPGVGEEQIRYLFAPGDNKFAFGEKDRVSLVMALKSAKILDPACGSGAFPMGVLNRMVDLLQKLRDEECSTPYEQKLHLIQNCIYGIDIQTIAVQISKLRFFISLVSEQNTNADPAKNYGIIPLPNLETKFVAANTLVGLQKEFTDRLDLGFTDIRLLKDELWDIRSKHFSARNSDEKQKLRKQDEKLRKQIQKLLVELTSKPDEAKLAQLKADIEALEAEKLNYIGENLVELANPKIQQVVLFETPANSSEQLTIKIDKNKEERNRISKLIKEKQKEIDKENSRATHAGFEKDALQLSRWDPYDQNTSSAFFDAEWMFDAKEGFDVVLGNPPYLLISKELFLDVYAKYYKLQEGKPDLYRIFIEKTLELSKSGGILSLITPNTFLTIPSCEKIRRYLVNNTTFISIVNYDQTVFESASVNNVVFVVKVAMPTRNALLKVTDLIKNKSLFDANSILIEQFHSQRNSKYEINIFSDRAAGKLIMKIIDSSCRLSDIENVDISLGLQPYHNTIHSDNEMKSRFLHSKIKENENFLIELGGKNIHKYYISELQDNFLNFSAELYTKPNIKFFNGERLVIREIVSDTLIVGLTKKKMLFNKSCYIVKSLNESYTNKYLLAILNSKLIGYYVKNTGDKSKQTIFPRITMRTLKSLPIIKTEHQQIITSIIDDIIINSKSDYDTSLLERKIDELVFKLYNLTYEEVKMVDPDFWLSEEEYERVIIK